MLLAKTNEISVKAPFNESLLRKTIELHCLNEGYAFTGKLMEGGWGLK